MRPARGTFLVLCLSAAAGCSLLESKIDRQISDMADRLERIDIHPATDHAPASSAFTAPAASAAPIEQPAPAPSLEIRPPLRR